MDSAKKTYAESIWKKSRQKARLTGVEAGTLGVDWATLSKAGHIIQPSTDRSPRPMAVKTLSSAY